jgi:hypothetical protein
LFSKFKRQFDTVFVDVNSADFELDESVNVILSPALYWVKKVTLPVKSLREVKPLLESLFEDILPEGRYSYTAYKEGDEYFIFAYEDKYILDVLAQKGIPFAKINKVYFAQSELASLEDAKKLNEEEIILVQDGVVILLPAKFSKTDEKLDLKDIDLSKHTIALKQFGHIVNEKSLYTIVALFFVMVLLVSSEYIITLNKIDKLQTQREVLFSKYKLKPTMIQNRSLLKRYERTYEAQIKLRKLMATVLSMHLKDGVRLKFVGYKNKKFKLQYMGMKKGQESYIESFFKNRGFTYSAQFKKDIWYVEFKI